MKTRPYVIDVPDDAVEQLRRKLRGARWPTVLDEQSWDDGAALAFVKRLTARWADEYDWRSQERRLNGLPHFMGTLGSAEVHFVHCTGIGPSPLPLVLTHGWPGSFVEMDAILPLLTNPGAHGGDESDAFHVVVPSLPGYGFSPSPTAAGTTSRAIAGLWRELMTGLGYTRFGAQGGDIGAGVSMWLARDYPDQLLGIHLNYVPGSFRPWTGDAAPVTPEEQAFLENAAAFSNEEGAYASLQATKPQTLAFALTDSPVGLAAWIVEKFRSWSDNGGDLESVVPLDTLLTDLSLYWFSGAIDASLRLYKENRREPLAFRAGERLGVPVGVAHFPRELPMPPRSWLERVAQVTRWSEMPSGGHFAALEQPGLLAEEIRAFFRPLRAQG